MSQDPLEADASLRAVSLHRAAGRALPLARSLSVMCRRVIQSSAPISDRGRDERARRPGCQLPAAMKRAPSQDLLVIGRKHQTGRYHCELGSAASMRPWRREQFSRRRPLVSCAK